MGHCSPLPADATSEAYRDSFLPEHPSGFPESITPTDSVLSSASYPLSSTSPPVSTEAPSANDMIESKCTADQSIVNSDGAPEECRLEESNHIISEEPESNQPSRTTDSEQYESASTADATQEPLLTVPLVVEAVQTAEAVDPAGQSTEACRTASEEDSSKSPVSSAPAESQSSQPSAANSVSPKNPPKRAPSLSSEEDDAPLLPVVKRAAVNTKKEPISPVKPTPKIPAPQVKPDVKKAVPASPVAAKSRKRTFVKTEENFEPINRWWEKIDDHNPEDQWKYMEHHGLMFFPPYAPHRVPIKFEGQPMVLPDEAEEVANFWCGVLESDYATKKVFRDNFWTAFKSLLPSDHPIRVANDMSKCDFTLIKEHLDAQKQRKKDMTKEEKEEVKRQKLEAEAPYAHALVDWIREKVGANKVEPAGLFRGRGEHPKQGQLKKRIVPEDVTLNFAEDAPVPRVAEGIMPGHCWNDICHDNTVTWMAYFKDTVNDQFKYMYLSAQSKFKGLSDFMKYEKARQLKNYVDAIRQDYKKKMTSHDNMERQLGTAVYLIDFLALRVGGEKDTDEEADTVGCCSLRIEHVQLNPETSEITLDFLGKDSIRYLNTVKIDKQAFSNIQSFYKSKKKDGALFDKINSGAVNVYLKELMPGLSAKVFRTYNASITLERELDKLDTRETDTSNVNEIVQFYNDANRHVAILCNHQRSIPKQHEASMEKMMKQLALVKEDEREIQDYIAFLKTKAKKFVFHSDLTDAAGNPRKTVVKDSLKEDVAKSKLKAIRTRIDNMDLKIRMKDDNKTVALGTSKINYMDPRISVAFCKKMELPIEKVFNKSLRLKFPWAMFATIDFKF